MKNFYITLIGIGIVVEMYIWLFMNKGAVAYGPMIFWVIGLFLLLNYISNLLKLSNSVKKTKPELFRKNSFGFMITKYALRTPSFLEALDDNELNIIEENKIILRFFLLCFALFGISGIMIFL